MRERTKDSDASPRLRLTRNRDNMKKFPIGERRKAQVDRGDGGNIADAPVQINSTLVRASDWKRTDQLELWPRHGLSQQTSPNRTCITRHFNRHPATS